MTRDEFVLPSGTINFATGSIPGLTVGNYTIGVTHTIDTPDGPVVIDGPSQPFSVQGPQFTLNPSFISSNYPPNDGADVYGEQLPFVAFSDPDLPWDIGLEGPGSSSPPLPWIALVLFAEGEITVDPATNSPLTTVTVGSFLSGSDTILPPDFTGESPPSSLLSTSCQVITITPAAFESVLPTIEDLHYLAHRRTVNVPGEPEQTVSALICNRLPIAATGLSPNAHVRYYAHVVSLQGFAGHLGGTIPSQYTAVQLISLYNWTFLSMPQTGANFQTVVQNLAAGSAPLALPLAGSPAGVPPEAVERINAGYVALDFHAFQTRTFAWYRGPFSATMASPSADPGVTATIQSATTSDALLIYLSEQGLFDASYAAAWNLGRGLALSNGSFTSAFLSYRQQAAAGLTLIAQRMGMPHLESLPPRALLRRVVTRRRLRALMNRGLGERWNDALANERAGPQRKWPRNRGGRPRIDPRALLARPDVVEALTESLSDTIQTLAGFLGSLSLLEGVPFSTLVPDARMLPVESIRFFDVDADWVAALIAGASSLALQTSLDADLHVALWPQLRAAIDAVNPASAPGTPTASPAWAMTGVLIRSVLVSGFPSVNITATDDAGAVPMIRDAVLAPSVRLCLFAGVPAQISIAEPFHGLRFGFEDGAVALRSMSPGINTLGVLTGDTVPGVSYVAPNGRIDIGGTGGLAAAIGVGDAGEFAMQLVQAPMVQNFTGGAS